MIAFLILFSFLLLGWQLSKLTLNKYLHPKLSLITISTVIGLSFLIYHHPPTSQVFNQVAESINKQGVAYPKSWKSRTKNHRDDVAACYYLTLMGAFMIFLINVASESIQVEKYKNRDEGGNDLGILMLFGLFFFLMFISGNTHYSGYRRHMKDFMFNNEYGLLFLSYGILEMAKHAGYIVRAKRLQIERFKNSLES